MIEFETARDIAFAYREIENAEGLLKTINDALERREVPDVRDAFGRLRGGLELGVPSGSGYRLLNVPWTLAKPIIEAHIAEQRAIIATLSQKAIVEVRLAAK